MTPAFSNPWTMQEIEKILELAKQQQPDMSQLTNAQPEPQPQASGTDIVNREMERAMRPAPNPYQIGLEQNIGAQKAIWEAANDTLNNNLATYAKTNGLTEDAARAMLGAKQQTAHDAAESFRNQLTASGLGTEGYSALGNSFADVQNQLATRQAQDIAEAFNGAYSMTTDQYYDRKYEEAIMRGLSARRANRLASSQAREYQANRVAYLDGLYNSWGRNEAGVTNPIGMQVLGMIAQDNPMLANLYAQVYPTPMNEYNNANEIAKLTLSSDNALRNAIEIAQIGHLNKTKEMDRAQVYNLQSQQNQALLTLQNEVFRDDRQAQAEIAKIAMQSEAKQREVLQKAQNGHQIAIALGFKEGTPEYQAVVYKSAMGTDLPNLNKNAFNDKLFSAGKITIETLQKQIEGIREQLSATDLPDNERATLESQLQYNIDAINKITNQLTGEFGVSIQEPDLPPFKNNPALDIPVIKTMLAAVSPDTSREDNLKNIVNWIHKTAPEMSVGAIEYFLVNNGLLPSKTEKSKPSSSNTSKSNQSRAEKGYAQQQQTYSANYLNNPRWVSR